MDDINEKLKELDRYISLMREVLDEMAATNTNSESSLSVSQCMDELIVEYMKLKHNL